MTRSFFWVTLALGLVSTAGCGGGSAAPDAGADAARVDDAGADAAGDADITDAAEVDGGPCAPARPPTACHTTTECNPGERCLRPGDTICGECMPPLATCATNADCGAGDVCVFFTSPCSCGGPSSTCRPRCTPGSCATDETCDVASGSCQPTSCTAGYACPAHTTCDPRPSADPHGCDRRACVIDGDCDCGGGCVEGYCYEMLGACLLPPP